ncbi:MAG TPA: TIM barrel protein [Negativicutes bacterium]|nr:TIM barrel protein [Negativicutes bacterium]
MASELGFSAIEFWDSKVKDVKRLGRIAAENNIKVAMCTLNGIFDNTLDNPYPVLHRAVNETISLMKDMGCGSMIIFSGNSEGKGDSQKNIIIENLKRLAEVADKENVNINIEPLNSTVE